MKKHALVLLALLLSATLALAFSHVAYSQETCPATDQGCQQYGDAWVTFQTPTVEINSQDQVAVHIGALSELPCVAAFGSGATCNIELVSYPQSDSVDISSAAGWPDYPSCTSVDPSTNICIANTVTGWSYCSVIDPSDYNDCTLVTNPTASTAEYTTPGNYYYAVFAEDSSGNCAGVYTGSSQPQCVAGEGILVAVQAAAPYFTIGGPTTAPGIAPVSQNENAFMALPGTSAYLNFLYSGLQCNSETFIELSAPGSSCLPPDSLSYVSLFAQGSVSAYCNEDLTGVLKDGGGYSCYTSHGYTKNSCIVPTGIPGSVAGTYGDYYSYSQLYAPGIAYNTIRSSAYATYVSGAQYPWPACLADTAWLGQSQAGLQSYCNVAYYTNQTLALGNYSVCAYYQPIAYDQDGNPYPVGSLPPPFVNYLNITANDIVGPSYGMYITNTSSTFPASNPGADMEVSAVANMASGSPFTDFYSSGGGVQEPASQNFCNMLSANGLCLMELASASPGNGCVAPTYPEFAPFLGGSGGGTRITTGSATLPYCNPAVSTNLPCLLEQTGTPLPTADGFSARLQPLGGFFQPSNSYVVCAYYYLNATYPTKAKNFLSSKPQQAPLSVFFASANIICDSSGTCTVGVSDQQEPAYTTTPSSYQETALGSISIAPSTLQWSSTSTQNSNVLADANGVSNPVDLYIKPFTSSSTSFVNFATACSEIGSSVTNECTGTAADGGDAGCYMSFLPDTTSDAVPGNCVQTAGSDTGYLTGTSCSCVTGYVPPGCTAGPGPDEVTCPSSCTADPNTGVITCSGGSSGTGTVVLSQPPGDSCVISTNSPYADQLIQPNPLQTEQYLYCETYNGGFVAGGFLNVVALGNGQQEANRGNVIVVPLTTELCSVYSLISQSLLVFSFLILLIGAVLYEAGTLVPSQLRGTMQGYAMGMIMGGIAGAVIVGLSAVAVSIIANIPVQSILLPIGCSIPYTSSDIPVGVA